jgi:hypothetical protein
MAARALGGRRDLVDDMQLVGRFAEDVIGTAVRRRHAGHEQITSRRRELAGLLVALKLQ